jgi:hypothetical protein
MSESMFLRLDYAVLDPFAFLLLRWLLPETKEKSLEELELLGN